WTVKYIKALRESGVVARSERDEARPERPQPLFETFDDLAKMPLDDQTAYRIFSTANTSAVFQFESRGMRDMLKRAKPDRFGDIIALVALYRPGPMDLIPSFCDRKQGKERISYPDPR